MSVEAIITIIVMGVALVSSLVILIVALCKGNLKNFIQEKMIEAEQTGKSGKEKLEYVLQAVREKYKLKVIMDFAKKLIEILIDFSKKVNSK